MAPMEIGVNGGRKVVVPTCGIGVSSAPDRIAKPLMLDSFPWSVAMPSVV